jgi:hypothetical protein
MPAVSGIVPLSEKALLIDNPNGPAPEAVVSKDHGGPKPLKNLGAALAACRLAKSE